MAAATGYWYACAADSSRAAPFTRVIFESLLRLFPSSPLPPTEISKTALLHGTASEEGDYYIAYPLQQLCNEAQNSNVTSQRNLHVGIRTCNFSSFLMK